VELYQSTTLYFALILHNAFSWLAGFHTICRQLFWATV